MGLEHVLKEKFGFTSFRPGQKEIIEDVLSKRDVLAMLPTGAGKSICYQLPGYLLDGSVLIISPLLSLMQDQVQQLKAKGEKQVIAINSFLPFEERKRALRKLHTYRFIYISPEALQSDAVINALGQIHVSLMVVDEAHCISQWGHDFRTDYLKLASVIERCHQPPVLALTATASTDIQEDIVTQLRITGAVRHIHSVDRPNIALSVQAFDTPEQKINEVIGLIQRFKGPGIIYTATRLWAELLADRLKQESVQAAFYHGGMSNEERILIQQQFIHNQLEVICATNAFGMGIDKADIRFVIHFQYPPDLESYLQEIGRAGRDGKQSVSILLYSSFDHELPEQLIQQELPTIQEVQVVLDYLAQENVLTWDDVELYSDQLGLSEVKQRFLKYHFEQLGALFQSSIQHNWDKNEIVAAIRKKIAERYRIKQEKLDGMRKFLKTKKCRRQEILDYYHEGLNEPPEYCCDVCGMNFADIQIAEPSAREWFYTDWEQELAIIFRQSGGI